SPKAKLKFACSPFCFGKYFFHQSGNKYIMLGCEAYDSFFSLTQDLSKYYAGMVALEFVDKMTMEGDYNNDLFVVTLKFLKELCYGQYKTEMLVGLFLKRALGFLGYDDEEMSILEYYEYLKMEFSVEIKALKMYCDINN
ncbi:MAG: DNA repair protein RecO C-terminal domain-containing protein, partial [Clostridia bacterium]